MEFVDARKRREDPRKKKARDMAKKNRRARRQEDNGNDWASNRHKVRQLLNQLDGADTTEAIQLGDALVTVVCAKEETDEST